MVNSTAEVLHTNAHSMDKQELEATVQLESCDLIVITETWWDEHVTGALQSKAINCSEGTRKKRWGELAHYGKKKKKKKD